MNVYALLGIGASGMRAGAFGVGTASNNAANAAVEGFTRRRAGMEPATPGLPIGGGVRVRGATRTVDAFLERRLLGARSEQGRSSATVDALGGLDRTLAADGGLVDALRQLDSAMADATAHPADLSVRRTVLGAASTVGRAFAQASASLSGARSDANDRIRGAVDDANALVRELGALNRQIANAELSGTEASDLRDQRDLRIEKLSALLPVSTIAHDEGTVSVLLAGGEALVTAEGETNELSLTTDPINGDVRVQKRAAGALVDVTGAIETGRMGGLIEARDGAIAGAIARLDALAFDIAGAYNGLHMAGVGLDGVSGRRLFDVSATSTGAASSLSLSGDIGSDPARLALAAPGGTLPGDNTQGLALLALGEGRIAAAGAATASQELVGILSSLGSSVAAAEDEDLFASQAASQVDALRASVSGVSIEEEMVSLTQYQRAYEASLRVVQTADQMLEELLNLKR